MRVLIFDTETTGLLPKSKSKTKTKSISIIDDTTSNVQSETDKNKSIPLNDYPYILQFSWLWYDLSTQHILDISDHYISIPDDVNIPIESSNIHGIDRTIIREKGKNINDVLKEFTFCASNSDMLIAHNLNFDKTVINIEYKRSILGIGYSPFKFTTNNENREKIEYCTMLKTNKFCNLKRYDTKKDKYVSKFPKLSELHEKLFDGKTPNNLHNSLIDILVCFRCFYKYEYGLDIIHKNTQIYNLLKKIL
jgi:DNA polymerase III epsilon subunit-like protein